MTRLALGALAAGLLAAAPLGAAEYGLVVGIDDYVFERPLKGAANDARDIARALQGRDPARLEVLLNQAASRAAVEAAWTSILAEAGEGDVIIFTYAGHGATEPDANGDERTAAHPDDRLDEVFLLANFTDGSVSGFAERIVDDEIGAWFDAARAKGVRVVFLADSCHSGTMTRQAASSRFAGAVTPPEGAPVAAGGAAPVSDEEERDNVIFIAGARQDQAVPEISIAGRMRGAASYAFARALEGAADRDRDGVVTRDELEAYIGGLTSSLSDQAVPSVMPLSRGSAPVFGGGGGPETAPAPEPPQITLATLSGASFGDWGRGAGEAAWGEATLNWDETSGVVVNSEGDEVANGVFGKIAMRRVVDKFSLLERVRDAAAIAPFTASLEGGGHVRRVGDRVELVIGARTKPYLTVFTLSNVGGAALAFPYDASEAGPQAPAAALRFAFEVTPDGIGVEHVVALATDRPPEELRAALAKGGPARQVFPLVDALLAGREVEAAIGRVVTKGP